MGMTPTLTVVSPPPPEPEDPEPPEPASESDPQAAVADSRTTAASAVNVRCVQRMSTPGGSAVPLLPDVQRNVEPAP